MYAGACVYQKKAVNLQRQTNRFDATLLILNFWFMRTKLLALVLGALLTIPTMLQAEEGALVGQSIVQ